MLSSKNRICNCINDESSQKKKNYTTDTCRQRQREMETDNMWVGTLPAFSYFWGFCCYYIVCTIKPNLKWKRRCKDWENMSPWGGPTAIPSLPSHFSGSTPKRRSWLLLDKGGKESNLVCDSWQGALGICHHALDVGVIATSQVELSPELGRVAVTSTLQPQPLCLWWLLRFLVPVEWALLLGG